MNTNKTLERFLGRVVHDNNGCWLWTGRLDTSGYGDFDFHGKTNKAHIYSFSALRHDVPSGLELDHLCRVRHCVNPEHLEPVTHLENMRRGKWAQ